MRKQEEKNHIQIRSSFFLLGGGCFLFCQVHIRMIFNVIKAPMIKPFRQMFLLTSCLGQLSYFNDEIIPIYWSEEKIDVKLGPESEN